MALKIVNGVYALKDSGLPEEIDGLEELLQDISLRLSLPKGTCPYLREAGSRLHTLDFTAEHAADRALSLAQESLLELPGVAVKSAKVTAGGIDFTVDTPLGSGTVHYKKGGTEDGEV